MHMTESQREKAFPIHIELGKSTDMPTAVPAPVDEKKPEKYYPTLYIDNIAGLEQLPEEGCILIDYKRRSLTVNKRKGKKPTCSVELEIHTICMPKDYEDTNDAEDIVDELVKKAYSEDEEDEDKD